MLEDSYLHARLFIEESLLTANPAFKLPDLIKFYTSQFSALGVHLEKRVHSASFKNRLLSQSAYNDKKEVILVFNHDVGEAISVPAEAIFKKTDNFKDGFEENSQESLLSFISCVIHALSATFCDIKYYKKAMLSASSNKVYTFIQNKKDSVSSYHSTQPLHVYLGLIIHNKTRDHSLIEKLSKLVRLMHFRTAIVPAFNIRRQYCN